MLKLAASVAARFLCASFGACLLFAPLAALAQTPRAPSQQQMTALIGAVRDQRDAALDRIAEMEADKEQATATVNQMTAALAKAHATAKWWQDYAKGLAPAKAPAGK
jgi:hypothetical protein